jgi:hypothetical protein
MSLNKYLYSAKINLLKEKIELIIRLDISNNP